MPKGTQSQRARTRMQDLDVSVDARNNVGLHLARIQLTWRSAI
jgi:hypothetical protein